MKRGARKGSRSRLKAGLQRVLGAGLCLGAASGPAWASPLDDARQALGDGQVQVAIYKLTSNDRKWANSAEQAAADLLLGEALIAAGRYQESVTRLSRLAEGNPTARFWLAEAHAALEEPEKALPLYQSLAALPEFASRAAVGQARALKQLWRTRDALAVLETRTKAAPEDEAVFLEWAEQALDAGDLAAAETALAGLKSSSPRAKFLQGRVLLARNEPAQAKAIFDTISTCPAQMAAGLAIARAEAELLLKEPAEAEKILESFIAESATLPGLAEVFAALDRVYAAQPSASSTELRRWAEDSNSRRGGFALFYLARNEVRAGNEARGREYYRQFVEKFPGNPLGLEARVALAQALLAEGQPEPALALLESEGGGRASFLRGRAEAALGRFKDAEASFLGAAETPTLEREALANAALCAMQAGVSADKNEAMTRLRGVAGGEAALERLEFLAAMHLAARRDPEAAARLTAIAGSSSPYAAQARLALAEWQAAQLDYEGAKAQLRLVSTQNGANAAVQERAEALGVFVADTGEPRADAEVKRLAEAFLKTYPDSAFAPEIHMKLGEMLYRRGDYLAARGEFNEVAEKFPDSPLAEKAVFLSARAMERSMDPKTMAEAIELYEVVATKGGPLSQRARLAQAMLFNALKKPKDALGVFDKILESKPDPELRATALTEAGETWFAQGEADPPSYQRAIATWKQLADDPSASRMWRNQARFRMGAAYEKLNQPDAALEAYYTVIAGGPRAAKDGGEPEYFWYYKAGFEAGKLLEERELWKEAIAVYEKISAVDGPRAGEAAERIKKLRLANFIWED
jgi:outer membrane protein assembly factor BamD (BamD/ComL family)